MEFMPAVVAQSKVRRDRHEIPGTSHGAFEDFKQFFARERIDPFYIHGFNSGGGGSFVLDACDKRLDDRLPSALRLCGDAKTVIENMTREIHFARQTKHERTHSDALHDTAEFDFCADIPVRMIGLLHQVDL